MKSKFHPFPMTEVTNVSDDALAQTIMLQLGVWDDVATRSPAGNVSMVVADAHPTHWCLCVRHWDNPDPKENGFQILAYPKKYVNRLEVEAMIPTYLRGATDVRARPIDLKPWE